MSFVRRQVAHCDICGHEWLTGSIGLLTKSGVPVKVPTHCAKCKSRKWNKEYVVTRIEGDRAYLRTVDVERTVEYEE